MRCAVLAAWLGVPESGIRFALGEKKKPFLPDWPHVHFNVSHSGGLYAVAVSEACEVGVDLEQVRDVPEKRDIARQYGLDEFHFFEDWTRREAYLKALGVGIYGLEDPVDPAIHVESFTVAEGYIGAWASLGGPLEPIIHRGHRFADGARPSPS